MKKDTVDAFGGDENVHVGTAFLFRLKAAMESGTALEKIFLVGHSTGVIYISHFLEAVNTMKFAPEVQFRPDAPGAGKTITTCSPIRSPDMAHASARCGCSE
jgi:hypothetical protein